MAGGPEAGVEAIENGVAEGPRTGMGEDGEHLHGHFSGPPEVRKFRHGL